MQARVRACAICAAVLAIAGFSHPAQQSQPELIARFAGGTNTFRIGERIPIELTSSSPNDTDYVISPMAHLGVRGNVCTTFSASPAAGWADPLETYFEQIPLTFSGPFPSPLTRSKPVVTSQDLNQWIRFDAPGDYTVTVTSGCISSSHGRPVDSLSAQISLHIVPATEEWQRKKLDSIRRDLEGRPADQESATADLRYLATPDGVDEMTHRLREVGYQVAQEARMGLVGLPESLRQTAIAAMEKRVEEPDFPISPLFFSTMLFLHVTPGSGRESIALQDRQNAPAIWSSVLSAVADKDAAARARTVQTLVENGSVTGWDSGAQIDPLLTTSFPDLDSGSQIEDLRRYWDGLNSPGILPAVERLALLPGRNDTGHYSREELKAVAFQRWYELDPAGARGEILNQIGSATPSLSAAALQFLPREPLPAFESIWAPAFLSTHEDPWERTLGSLLVRFGTGAAATQMIAKLAQPPGAYDYPCDAHVVALAYLVRFGPAEAVTYVQEEVATNAGRCGPRILEEISRLATGPALNDVAVASLDSTDPEIVRDAIRYLTSYGRAQDEDPLWRHYLRWTEQWKDDVAVLDAGPGQATASRTHDARASLIGEGAQALLCGQGWFANETLVSRVLSLCADAQMCNQISTNLRLAVAPYLVLLPDAGQLVGADSAASFNVGQYAPRSLNLLGEKIAQYPTGTQFVLRSMGPTTNSSDSDQRKLVDQVRTLFERHGMSVVN